MAFKDEYTKMIRLVMNLDVDSLTKASSKMGKTLNEQFKASQEAWKTDWEDLMSQLTFAKLKGLDTSELENKAKIMQTQGKTFGFDADISTGKIEQTAETITEVYNQFNEDSKSAFTKFKEGFTSAFDEFKNESVDWNDTAKKSYDKMKNTIKQYYDKILRAVKDFVKAALEEMQNLASYDLLNSSTYNSSAVDMYTNYGLSGSQAYGMSKALTAMFGSGATMETFLNALPTMNQKQLDYMQEIMTTAENTYEQNLEISQAYSEFQQQFELFKTRLQSSVIQFFGENKDEIMALLNATASALEALLSLVSNILSLFSSGSTRTESQRQQSIADILGVSSSSITSNKNTNVKIDNTFNGVGKTDQSWLANTGQMTYQQIIAALK